MKWWIWIGLGLSVIVATLLSPFASSRPDGLERVAENLGFADMAVEDHLVASPLADYLFPWVSDERIATALAGLVGTLIVFAGAVVLARVLRVRKG